MATKPKSRKVKAVNTAPGSNGQPSPATQPRAENIEPAAAAARAGSTAEPKTGNVDTPISNRASGASLTNGHAGNGNHAVESRTAAGERESAPADRVRVKKKKAPAPPAAPEIPSERNLVHTLEERMSALGSIDSLKKPLPPQDATAQISEVDSSAPPPPAPLPPPEQEPAPSGSVDRGAPIPEHYGLDRLVVLLRDPHWLYLYWELKGGSLERLRFQHSAEIIDSSRWVLRVKTLHMPQMDSADRGANEYIVDIDLRVGQWYLKVSPSTTFRIDLGFIDQQGQFLLVLPGNEVRTPAPGVSNVSDERWMIMREELERLLKAGGSPHPVAPFPSITSNAAQRIQRSEKPRSLGLFSSHSVIQRSEP